MGKRQRLDEAGRLRHQAAIGVQRERAAIEHQLVLAADLVDVEQRQAGLGDACHGQLQPLVLLAVLERRAVGDDQDLGPALTQALGDVLEPHVLADHDTQAYRLARGQRQAHRARDRAGLEDALLVEHAVVGQGMLVDPADDGATGEHERGVVEPPAVAPRGTHDQGRAAIGGVAGELIQGVARVLADGRLEHQVLGRVAHQEQLGQHEEIGPGRGPLRP